MSQRFGARPAAVASAQHDVNQLVAGLVERQFSPQNSADVQIDVLAHGSRGFWIGREFDDRLNGIADHVALAGGKRVHDVAGRRHQRHALGRRRGRIRLSGRHTSDTQNRSTTSEDRHTQNRP